MSNVLAFSSRTVCVCVCVCVCGVCVCVCGACARIDYWYMRALACNRTGCFWTGSWITDSDRQTIPVPGI